MTLPFDIIRNVVSFLPYTERVDANRVLPIEHRIVKRVESDNHNLHVKVNLIRHKLARFDKSQPRSRERVKIIKQVFLYILHTKDTVLLTKSTAPFHNVIIEKAKQFLTDEAFDVNMLIRHRKEIISLRRVCEKLISKIEGFTPATSHVASRFVMVI